MPFRGRSRRPGTHQRTIHSESGEPEICNHYRSHVISADGKRPPPPLIICPGKRIMESWIHDNLKGSEVIALSPTGYTNESIAVAWLTHFIKHTNAGPDKPWKMLLLDGHITHENADFVILAHDNHIKPSEYPSHLNLSW